MSDTPEAWGDWLRSFREQFIAAKGWSAKEAKRCIRDTWAVVRGVHVHVLTGADQRPADAIPIFEILTSGGWKRPLPIIERLTGLVTKAMVSQRAPRDIVIGLLSQIEHAEGPDESDEVLKQRHTAALWARRLIVLCEHESLSGAAGTDIFWNAILFSLQTGRRLAILELYRDPQAFHDLIKAQAFQSGRGQDEVTRRLKARWLELRATRGRPPKLREVAAAAGGKWSDTEACWQFDGSTGSISVTHRGLRERLKEISRSQRT